KAAHAIAIPDGHWREKSVCRRFRRLPDPARTGEGGPPAQTPGHARRHGREFSGADCESSGGCPEAGRVERAELWEKFSVLSSQFLVNAPLLSWCRSGCENRELASDTKRSRTKGCTIFVAI